MNHTLSEQKVLKQLGISDFRHLSKDNIVKFVSTIPKMDPEVAKKAIDQFPTYSNCVKDMLLEYKSTLTDLVEKDHDTTKESISSYLIVLDTLRELMNRDDLSFEERKFVLTEMHEISDCIAAKDSEGKKFKFAITALATIAVTTVAASLASVLGSNVELSNPSNEED